MKKFIIAIVLLFSLKCYAGEPHRGYRGFLEWENTIGDAWTDCCSEPGITKEAVWLTGLATSHGYQFNHHIYFGAGTLLAIPLTGVGFSLPVYANFRYDASFGKAKPFGDLRIGYDISENSLYFSPTIGYRISIGKKSNFNVGTGISLRQSEVCGEKHTELLYSLRLGIDF